MITRELLSKKRTLINKRTRIMKKKDTEIRNHNPKP